MVKQFAATALLCAALTTAAVAAEPPTGAPEVHTPNYMSSIVAQPRSDESTSTMTFDVGSPYYTNLSNIIASFVIEDGKGYCGSSFQQRTTKRAVMTTEMQRKKSTATTWSTVKTWSDEFDTKGAHLVEHSYDVVSGYQYRNYVTIKFYSGSTVIEEVSLDSPVKLS